MWWEYAESPDRRLSRSNRKLYNFADDVFFHPNYPGVCAIVPPLRIVPRDIKDRRRGRKNQFAPATSPGVINSADSTILFAGCRRAREGNDVGAPRRAAGVLFARVLNWLTRPPPLPVTRRARAILNFENGSSLVSPESRIQDSVAWDSRRAAIWIHPCPPNQFQSRVPLTIEGVRVWVLERREGSSGGLREGAFPRSSPTGDPPWIYSHERPARRRGIPLIDGAGTSRRPSYRFINGGNHRLSWDLYPNPNLNSDVSRCGVSGDAFPSIRRRSTVCEETRNGDRKRNLSDEPVKCKFIENIISEILFYFLKFYFIVSFTVSRIRLSDHHVGNAKIRAKISSSAANSEKVHLIERHCSEFDICDQTLLTTVVDTFYIRAFEYHCKVIFGK